MKANTIKITWEMAERDIEGKLTKGIANENIELRIAVLNSDERIAATVFATMENMINEKLEELDCEEVGESTGCSDFDNNEYTDTICFEKSYGSVAEQKNAIMRIAREVKKDVVKMF